jgi:L-alanine-DL-glutamate epimerase-like enolase superfamily enzyme
VKIDWETLAIEPEHPFRISRSVQERAERVWVRIEADGEEGWGEADPSPYYGETAETVTAALRRMRPAVETATEPEGLEGLERSLLAVARGDASAVAAVVAALYDLVGKRAGVPVWRTLGLEPSDAPPSSFTIGLDEPEAMAEKASRAAAYPILKIKLGTDRDEAILEAVRGAAPDRILRVDANAAWSAEEAVERSSRLADFGVEFVEQPLPPAEREGYRYLYERSPLPIIADESCIVARDIPGLVGQVHGINIKMAKCGGPREALRMIHTARACGLRVMLGCMLETTLGIAAAAHLAPLVDYADLDGAALLREDPFRGPHLDGGRIVLGGAPGLGVTRA